LGNVQVSSAKIRNNLKEIGKLFNISPEKPCEKGDVLIKTLSVGFFSHQPSIFQEQAAQRCQSRKPKGCEVKHSSVLN